MFNLRLKVFKNYFLNFKLNSLSTVSKKQLEKTKQFVQSCIDNELPDPKLEKELKSLKASIKNQVRL